MKYSLKALKIGLKDYSATVTTTGVDFLSSYITILHNFMQNHIKVPILR